MAGIGPHKGPSNFIGFLRSALSAGTRELVGLPPEQDIQIWRASHPMGSFLSSLAGFAVPVAGWAGAATRIPAMARAIRAAGAGAETSPFLRGAAQEITRFAPFEAARLGGTLVVGGDFGQVAFESGFDLAGAGIIGGAARALRAARSGEEGFGKTEIGRISELVPDFSLDAPLQTQIRALQAAKLKFPDEVALFDKVIENRTLGVFNEAPATRWDSNRPRYVNGVHLDFERERNVDRLFQLSTGENKSLVRMAFRRGANGFDTTMARKKFLADAGIGDPQDFASSSMFPRAIEARSRSAAKRVDAVFRGDVWQQLGDGWFMTREAFGNQLVIMAKKIGGHSAPNKGDKYLLFKTDSPAKFVPELEQYKDRQLGFWNRVYEPRSPLLEDEIGKEVPVYNVLQRYNAVAGPDVVAQAYATLPKTEAQGAIAKAAKALSETVFGKRRGAPVTDEIGRVGQIAKEYLFPAEFQFSSNVRARAAFGMAKAAENFAVAQAHKRFFGDTRTLSSGYRYALAREPSGGLQKIIDQNLDAKNIGQFQQVVQRGNGLLTAELEIGTDTRVINVLRALEQLDNVSMKELQKAYELVGDPGGFKALQNHYMMTRTWRGDQRVAITDETGARLLAVAAGETREKAMNLAKAFVKEADAEGLGAKIGRTWTRGSRSEDLETAARIVRDSKTTKAGEIMAQVLGDAYEPGFTHARTGVRGFIGDFEKLTVKDVKEIVKEHLEAVEKLKAELVTRNMLERTLEKINAEDTTLGRVLNKRIDDLFGKAGPWTQAINSAADRLLAPVIGGQSATKIARAVNTSMFNLSFGFGNVGFAVLNAVTPVITALPEAAFVMNARPATLMRYYGIAPLMGADGTVRGATGFLEPMRVLRDSFRRMGKPDATLKSMYDRAALEGVTDPRMVEEFVGTTSTRATNLRSIKDVGSFIKAVSEWLPGTSEKFARLQAFTMGDIIGREILGMKGEALYQFARRFTERTMYNYSGADRARLMTGPLGSVFGLYKNWMMHYVGNWMIYANEAIAGGQWKPLLWATASAWTTGGLMGMGPASALLDGAARVLGDDKPMYMLYSNFAEDKKIADSIFYGLPGLFGLSLVTSGAAPGSEVMRDIGFIFNLAIADRAKALGRAVGNAVNSFSATGRHPIQSELVRDNFARAFAPRSMYRALAVIEDDELKSLNTGTPLVKGFDTYKKLMYSAGLTPVEVDKTFAAARDVWADQKALKNQVQWLGRWWQQAEESKDFATLTRVYNIALGMGIADRVMRSVRSREARESQDVLTAASRQGDVVQRARTLGVGQ